MTARTTTFPATILIMQLLGLLCFENIVPVSSFMTGVVGTTSVSPTNPSTLQQQRGSLHRLSLASTSTSDASADTTSADSLLRPKYDIEPIAIRIGHGFDIHRMAPIEEAGQPVVIGGVIITHTDQKVRNGILRGGIWEK
jgi:hypothetical protein